MSIDRTKFIKNVNWDSFKETNGIQSDYIVDGIIEVLEMEHRNGYPAIFFPESFKRKLNQKFIFGRKYSKDGLFMEDLLAYTRFSPFLGVLLSAPKNPEERLLYSFNQEPFFPIKPQKEVAPEKYIEYVRTDKLGCMVYVGLIFWLLWFLACISAFGEEGVGCFVFGLFIFGLPSLFFGDFRLIEHENKYKEKRYSSGEIKRMQMELDKKYEDKMILYNRLVDEYPTNKAKYEDIREKQRMKIEESKNRILKCILHEALRKSLEFTQIDKGPQKGSAEDKLFYSLMKHMPKGTVIIDGKVGKYYPDLIIKAGRTYIDIEIDEPYEYGGKKETHYIGCGDRERNDFFLDNDWFVIRFSENQIKNQIDDCVSIVYAVRRLLKDFFVVKNFLDIIEKISEPFWTKEEARMMAIESYRDRKN